MAIGTILRFWERFSQPRASLEDKTAGTRRRWGGLKQHRQPGRLHRDESLDNTINCAIIVELRAHGGAVGRTRLLPARQRLVLVWRMKHLIWTPALSQWSDAPGSVMRTGEAVSPLKSRYVALSPRILRGRTCGANHGLPAQESARGWVVRPFARLCSPFWEKTGDTACRPAGELFLRPRSRGDLRNGNMAKIEAARCSKLFTNRMLRRKTRRNFASLLLAFASHPLALWQSFRERLKGRKGRKARKRREGMSVCLRVQGLAGIGLCFGVCGLTRFAKLANLILWKSRT